MGQTFELTDLPSLLFLSFLEIVLSVDNALVLSLLSRALPAPLRRKALWIGIFSAFFLRAGALLFVSWLLGVYWIRWLGGAYLLYLAVRHFYKARRERPATDAISFWKTVVWIELFDLAFALDSIVAGIAFIATPDQEGFSDKLWIVYVGGMLGLIAIRYAAELFNRLLEKFPRLDTSAYLLVGWIGVKLLVVGAIPSFEWLFWGVFVLILGAGIVAGRRAAK